jgi:hypothetical protein
MTYIIPPSRDQYSSDQNNLDLFMGGIRPASPMPMMVCCVGFSLKKTVQRMTPTLGYDDKALFGIAFDMPNVF